MMDADSESNASVLYQTEMLPPRKSVVCYWYPIAFEKALRSGLVYEGFYSPFTYKLLARI
jgi:hypothetical protein